MTWRGETSSGGGGGGGRVWAGRRDSLRDWVSDNSHRAPEPSGSRRAGILIP